MNNDIAHQIGQILTEHHSGFWHRLGEWVGGAVTAALVFLGTVGGEFSRIFDPTTWTMATIASLFSIPAAIMYFMAKYTERKVLKKQLEILEESNRANTSN